MLTNPKTKKTNHPSLQTAKMNVHKLAIISFTISNLFSLSDAAFDFDRWSQPKKKCVKYWEWTLDEDMVINDKQYYGFQMDGSVGTFTLPLYDNPDLEGAPVARLRGNMIAEPAGGFNANAALYFFEELRFSVGAFLLFF